MGSVANVVHREPWNKGKIVGQKAPFKLKDIWALRVRLQMENRVRELALFNLGIDSKLRACDLVALKVCGSMSDGIGPQSSGDQARLASKPNRPWSDWPVNTSMRASPTIASGGSEFSITMTCTWSLRLARCL